MLVRTRHAKWHLILLMVGWSAVVAQGQSATEPSVFSFETQPKRLIIRLAGQPIASYVAQDEIITRPYFCDLRTPSGRQVTRNHPPIPGQDLTDHDTFHPGLWLAFGDLSGSDFWRLKAPVRSAGMVDTPSAHDATATFGVKNRYLTADHGQLVCEETCRYTFTQMTDGYLLECDSLFENHDADFVFGDQEEMGLGVRLATPLIVKNGGTILNSQAQRNEAQAWGKPAKWCDYSGTQTGRRIGVMMMLSPHNFRESWFHVRDYGLMVGNPFGRNAMTGGEASRVVVARGKPFRLRYGLFIYEQPSDTAFDHQAHYDAYLKRLPTE